MFKLIRTPARFSEGEDDENLACDHHDASERQVLLQHAQGFFLEASCSGSEPSPKKILTGTFASSTNQNQNTGVRILHSFQTGRRAGKL